MGATPLRALNYIERHRLVLCNGVGKPHPWFGRMLLTVYLRGISDESREVRSSTARICGPYVNIWGTKTVLLVVN